MFDFLFIYDTDRYEDDSCRTIRASDRASAIAAFKAQMIAEGQTVVVHAIQQKAA